jgi:hypothetical protein
MEIFDKAFFSVLNDKVGFIKSNNIIFWDILKEKISGDSIKLHSK